MRKINMRPGVDVKISTAQKDELILEGNSVEAVSQCAADIQQVCRVRKKDIRKVIPNSESPTMLWLSATPIS